jgi:hypothetical protein
LAEICSTALLIGSEFDRPRLGYFLVRPSEWGFAHSRRKDCRFVVPLLAPSVIRHPLHSHSSNAVNNFNTAFFFGVPVTW